MAIVNVEQTVCDEPGCEQLGFWSCRLCSGDMCGTAAHSVSLFSGGSLGAICLACYRFRFPEFNPGAGDGGSA